MAFLKRRFRTRPLDERDGDGWKGWSRIWSFEVLPALLEIRDELGRQSGNETSVSADYDVLRNDRVIYADASAGAVTLSVLAAEHMRERRLLVFKVDSSGNAVTLSFYDGETCSGQASIALSSQYDGIEIKGTGDTYYTISTSP